MLNPLLYVVKKVKAPTTVVDLFIAGLLLAGILIIPSYMAFFYKVTFSMGGWRVPLIKFSWFWAFFVLSNGFWLLSLIFLKRDNKALLWLFLLSNTVGAVIIGTDFVHYNLFMEHWSADTLLAAFIGMTGGQAPLGIQPLYLVLAIGIFILVLTLLLTLAKLIPKPFWLINITPVVFTSASIGVLLLLVSLQQILPSNWHSRHLQTYIPWITFVPAKDNYVIDDKDLLKMSDMEAQKAHALLTINENVKSLNTVTAKRLPNILMVHVEGMRADMLTPETMPKLSAFSKKHGEVLSNHYSSSNNTGQGMFGLLTGLYGAYYQNFREQPVAVAPIAILKKLGYQLTAHNSMSDEYENLGNLFFSDFTKHNVLNGTLAENDAKLFKETGEQLASFKTGNNPRFDYVFLNSTHFPYEYPDTFRKHKPVMEGMNYDTSIRGDMETNKTAVKNTFMNAVLFADDLLSGLVNKLVDTNYWNNTIVIIVGDHGQEFWEHNRFGHVYGLTKEQTQVLAYVSFPGGLNTQYELTSHSDFFPTIFSYMDVSVGSFKFMSGKNLYQYNEIEDYAVIRMSVLAAQKRYEEGIITKDLKVLYHLKDELSIKAVSNPDDELVENFETVKKDAYLLIKHLDKQKRAHLNAFAQPTSTSCQTDCRVRYP